MPYFINVTLRYRKSSTNALSDLSTLIAESAEADTIADDFVKCISSVPLESLWYAIVAFPGHMHWFSMFGSFMIIPEY